MAFVAIAAIVIGGLLKAKASHDAGVAANDQAKFQSRIEGDAAQGREIQRRQDLLRALSSQNAAAGAAGAETGGSIGGIARTNIKQNQQDLLTDAAGTGARRAALLAQGANADKAGNLAAAGSLMDTVASAASMGKGGGGGKS